MRLMVIFICLFFCLHMFALDGHFGQLGMDQVGLYNTVASLKGVSENAVLGSAGLAIGTTSTEAVLVANTTPFLIDGVFYSKTSAEVKFTATTHDIAATSETKEAYYVYSINSAGTVTVTMGVIAPEGYGALPDYTDLPSDQAILGYLKLVVNSGQTFDARTTALDNSTVLKSATYTNTSFLKKLIGPKSPKITVDFLQE